MQETNFDIMEKAPVSQAILKLSLPTVLSTIISLLYNLTDTYFIGLLDDPIQLSAIALAFPAFTIIQAIGNIFGNGAPAYISRCLGFKDYEEVRRVSAVSIYTSAGLTLVMTVLGFLFMDPILDALGTDGETFGTTREYLQVIAGFSIVMVLQVILPALLRAEGRVKEAVIGMVIGTVLNIILDPVFILLLGQGVSGAAWATIIGNICAVVFYIMVYLKSKTTLSILPRDFRPSTHIFKEVLKIGLPMSLAQIMISITTLIMNNLAAVYGYYVISSYGVASKLSVMVAMIMTGYVSGYMPFAGYNFGAGNFKRMLSAFRFTVLTGTGLCVVLMIPCVWLAPAYMRAFTSVPEIIDVGIYYLHATAFAMPLFGLEFTLMSTFQAMGKAVPAMIVNLGRQCLFYIPFLYLFNHLWQLDGLLYAQTGADYLTTLTALLLGIPLLLKLYKERAEEGKSNSGNETIQIQNGGKDR